MAFGGLSLLQLHPRASTMSTTTPITINQTCACPGQLLQLVHSSIPLYLHYFKSCPYASQNCCNTVVKDSTADDNRLHRAQLSGDTLN